MREAVTGLILAGGQGRRMGGVDKGLTELAGKPFVAHVLERLAPQVDEIIISANQNLDCYRALDVDVVADDLKGFQGPLAGLAAGLRHARHPLVATVPCDSPFLPDDLVARLCRGLLKKQADLAIARTGEQVHPVFALVRREVLPGLEAFLAQGGRKIDQWYASLAVADVDFSDEADCFININTQQDLVQAEHNRLAGQQEKG